MKNINVNKRISLWIIFSLSILIFGSCQKRYYEDSGLQKGGFNLSCIGLLEKDTFLFDSVVTIIHLSGMDEILEDSAVTFFSPTDHSIAKTMDVLNSVRHNEFEDSLGLQDVPKEVWRAFLSRYVFRGKYMLKDISRWDPAQLNVYPGMNMKSWDGYIMNLGVKFSNYEGTKDVGPRTLSITNIGDLANPKGQTSKVATSDLQTLNGVVHVLEDSHDFGFSTTDFVNTVERYIN